MHLVTDLIWCKPSCIILIKRVYFTLCICKEWREKNKSSNHPKRLIYKKFVFSSSFEMSMQHPVSIHTLHFCNQIKSFLFLWILVMDTVYSVPVSIWSWAIHIKKYWRGQDNGMWLIYKWHLDEAINNQASVKWAGEIKLGRNIRAESGMGRVKRHMFWNKTTFRNTIGIHSLTIFFAIIIDV